MQSISREIPEMQTVHQFLVHSSFYCHLSKYGEKTSTSLFWLVPYTTRFYSKTSDIGRFISERITTDQYKQDPTELGCKFFYIEDVRETSVVVRDED